MSRATCLIILLLWLLPTTMPGPKLSAAEWEPLPIESYPRTDGYRPDLSFRTAQTPMLPEYVDVDEYAGAGAYDPAVQYDDGWMDQYSSLPGDEWCWQILPSGIIYSSYLAGTKESRFSLHLFHADHDGWLFDGTLGARVGLLRFGDRNPYRPEGFQIDAEGSGQVRLDIPEERDVRAVDFRAGVPLTYGVGPHRWKFGYYHLSSHVGDEFLLKNPGFTRMNYSRDVLVLGYAYYLTDMLRIYGEAGWAFYSDVCKEWEFQFGLDYSPAGPTGIYGAPFWAVNGHLRQEIDFSGVFTAQVGWAWKSDFSTAMLRTGLHYLNGQSNQLSFYNTHEHQIGWGLWYDF